MCGIAGILEFAQERVDPDALRAMTEMLSHRGPDGGNTWLGRRVGLGHRRLSIIDLSDRAAQPMKSRDDATIITFNGEIYNYKELATALSKTGHTLRTTSDTEVILTLYEVHGIACLEYLRGMFAFAIWDGKKKQLFLARDRVGIKPLYYLLNRNRVVFASEIKAIAVSGYSSRKIDSRAFSQYLRLLVVPQPQTIFEDVQKLEPGRYLAIGEDGSVKSHTYWKAEPSVVTDDREDERYIDGLRDLLNESVRYHMVADVPVSAFLSGGLDSSAVVALMRENAPKQDIATFSTVFPGLPQFDEGRYAHIVAESMRTHHHANEFDQNFLHDYGKISWHLDEPFAVSSAYATFYLAKSAAEHTKVVLTGDGGDELFAGYSGYTNDAYLRHPSWVATTLTGIYSVTYLAERLTKTRNKKIYRLLSALCGRSGSEGLRYSGQVAQNSLYAMSLVLEDEVFLASLGFWRDNLLARYYDACESKERLLKKLYSEYMTRLVDEMLMKVDRMTMAHSLEARVPLLDHKVVEYAFQIPAGLKLRVTDDGQATKYVLKKAMEKYLPRDIIYRNKQGFNIPIKHWMHGAFLAKVSEKVLDGVLVKNGIVDREGVIRLLKLQKDGAHNYNNMLMLLLAFEVWVESYRQNIGEINWA